MGASTQSQATHNSLMEQLMYMTNTGSYYPAAGGTKPRDYYSKDSFQEVHEQKS